MYIYIYIFYIDLLFQGFPKLDIGRIFSLNQPPGPIPISLLRLNILIHDPEHHTMHCGEERIICIIKGCCKNLLGIRDPVCAKMSVSECVQ